MLKRSCLIISLLILSLSCHAKKGYEFIINVPDTTKKTYILSGYFWGDKKEIDTVRSGGKIIFAGNIPLAAGQYIIEEDSRNPDRLSLQFIIPSGNKKAQSYIYKVGPSGTEQKKGSRENKVYIQLQNFLRYGTKEIKSAEELKNVLSGFRKKAGEEAPGSLLEYILKDITSDFKRPEDIIEGFPFDNPAIINSAFGKEKVIKYLKAIKLNPNDTIIKLVNNLITKAGEETGKGEKALYPAVKRASADIQTLIASTVFNYFKDGDIMGQEAVAVSIAQEWFLNGRLKLEDSDRLFLIKTFTELNKHSLIGMTAPELNLTDTAGNFVKLSSLQGEYTIIYFYTDDCITCKIETPKLIDFVNEYKEGTLNVYAVYAHDNAQKWREYIEREFALYNPFVNWIDVYDPQFESGFNLLYNVISTPQMFLLDKDGTIIGRNIKTKQLSELLEVKNRERDDMHKFFDNFFTKLGDLDTATVNMSIDAFYNKSIHNPELFREIFKELYNFLRLSPDYLLQNGAAYLAKTYIAGKENLWNNKNFIEHIKKALEIYNMNPLGSKAADLSLEDINGSPVNLYDIKNEYKVLYFYKIDCGTCSVVSKELKKLYELYKNRNNTDIEFVAINTGTGYGEWLKYIADNGFSWINLWDGENNGDIYKKYYINGVPNIYLLKDNTVIAKDITDADLKELLGRISAEKQ